MDPKATENDSPPLDRTSDIVHPMESPKLTGNFLSKLPPPAPLGGIDLSTEECSKESYTVYCADLK